MRCIHCGRHISPASLLPNGSRYMHADDLYRQCHPQTPDSTWAAPTTEATT